MEKGMKKSRRRPKLILSNIIIISLILLYLLQQRISNGGWSLFHEEFFIPSLQEEPRFNDASLLKETFYSHEDHHHHDHEGHDHHQKVKFVLRDSNLGSPEFIGSNQDSVEFINRGSETILNVQDIDLSAFSFVDSSYTETNIAIGCALTTKSQNSLDVRHLVTEMPFFKSLLPSFCSTATKGFNYNFYVGHDHNDDFFSKNASHIVFSKLFYDEIKKRCFKTPNVTLHLVECQHSGHPAWAQNDAMMAAYMDNMDYYYRINDDTIMETSGWTTRFIDELLRFNPPNVGVVGPWFREGNTMILTYDFVHRSHIDIFGSYYPRVFTDWFADDWISGVYWPDHMRKVAGTRVKHTMERGQRYLSHSENAKEVEVEIKVGKSVLKRYIERRMNKTTTFKGWDQNITNVISMSLSGSDVSKVFGCLRYALLQPFIFEGWRLRVYTSLNDKSPNLLKVVARKLENFGVEVVNIERKDPLSRLSPSLWRYLVIDDRRVSSFIVRDSDTRPTEREFAVLQDWISLSPKAFYCIRDHPSHSMKLLNTGLVGGVPHLITKHLGHSFKKLLSSSPNLTEEQLLNSIIQPRFSSEIFCHDSVSCLKFNGSHKLPVLRHNNAYIGQKYDSNEKPIIEPGNSKRNKSDKLSSNDGECVHLKNTGFAEKSVERVLKENFTLWSISYHTTPLSDLKSLLNPIGINIIDKSFSSDCHVTNTCAKDLRIINVDNGLALNRKLVRAFYKSYKEDPVMKPVTAFICILPVTMCSLYRPFHKAMMVWASIRYEQTVDTVSKWKRLNNLLETIAKDPSSVLAANNLYDAKYIEYFTGLKTITIPNYFAYLPTTLYTPSRPQFLLSPIHSNEANDLLFREFQNIVAKRNLDLSIFPLRDAYPHYSYSDLTSHPGIIHIPYQVSMVSLTEQYRMNIPLLVPSLDLLVRWHLKYQVVRSRTWTGYKGEKGNGSMLTGVYPGVPDPNNDMDEEAVRYWLKFADFYQWPHIIYFTSIEDLVEKMVMVDFEEVSRRMGEWNRKERKRIKGMWSEVLMKLGVGGGNGSVVVKKELGGGGGGKFKVDGGKLKSGEISDVGERKSGDKSEVGEKNAGAFGDGKTIRYSTEKVNGKYENKKSKKYGDEEIDRMKQSGDVAKDENLREEKNNENDKRDRATKSLVSVTRPNRKMKIRDDEDKRKEHIFTELIKNK